MKEFDESKSVKFWMSSLPNKEGVESTKYHWKRQILRFCNWIGKSPDELIEKRKEHLASSNERIRHHAEMKLKGFLRFLEEKGLAPHHDKNLL